MRIFSKILSETDIKRRCAIPMKYFKMKHFPKPTVKGNLMEYFVVKDECGSDWILCCSIRNVGNDPNHPKHPKPVLIKEWVSFSRNKGLLVGDRVIINEEQDETGSIQRRIKVERQLRPQGSRSSPVKNPNLGVRKVSISHNQGNESTATFQPFEDPSADVQNKDLGGTGTTAAKTSTIEKQISTPHSTYQDIACYNMEGPSLELTMKPTSPGGATASRTSTTAKEHISTPHISTPDIACYKVEGPSLELTLKPTLQGGTTAVTCSHVYKDKIPTLQSTSQDIACYKTEILSLSLNLGLTLKPTTTGQQKHDYMQVAQPKTINFLG